MVYETDFEIRFVICELTLTFIQSSCFKNPEDIQFLVFFLIKQVVIHDEEIKEKVRKYKQKKSMKFHLNFFRKT